MDEVRESRSSLRTLLLALELASLIGLGVGGYVVLRSSPTGSPPPQLEIGNPTFFSANGSNYAELPLLHPRLAGISEVGLALDLRGLPLPLPFPAHPPWIDDLLCGSGGLLPGMTSWAVNVTQCHAEPGYWYAVLVNSTGAVLDIQCGTTSGLSPAPPSPAWFAAAPPAGIVGPGDRVVLVTTMSLENSGYEFLIGISGQSATFLFSTSTTPLITFELGTSVVSAVCAPGSPGGASGLVVDNLTLITSENLSIDRLALRLLAPNHTLAQVGFSSYASCQDLPRSSPSSPMPWAAILWGSPYRPLAYYSNNSGGPAWTLFPNVAMSALYRGGTFGLEMLSPGGLTSVTLHARLSLAASGGVQSNCFGGTLTDGNGVLFT